MSTHNICRYKEVKKKYTGCNLKTTEFLHCALIGVCVVIRSNTVLSLLLLLYFGVACTFVTFLLQFRFLCSCDYIHVVFFMGGWMGWGKWHERVWRIGVCGLRTRTPWPWLFAHQSCTLCFIIMSCNVK